MKHIGSVNITFFGLINPDIIKVNNCILSFHVLELGSLNRPEAPSRDSCEYIKAHGPLVDIHVA